MEGFVLESASLLFMELLDFKLLVPILYFTYHTLYMSFKNIRTLLLSELDINSHKHIEVALKVFFGDYEKLILLRIVLNL